MDFKTVLEHHILDHKIAPFLSLGGLELSITKHLLCMWAGSLLLIGFFLFLRTSKSTLARRFNLMIEAIVIYLRDEVILEALGEHGKKYLHYFLTLFFFILTF